MSDSGVFLGIGLIVSRAGFALILDNYSKVVDNLSIKPKEEYFYMKPVVMKFLLILMIAGLLAGCSAAAATPTTDPKMVYTQVAQTVAAQITNAAKLTPKATLTPLPTETLAPSPTAKPTNATIVALTGTVKVTGTGPAGTAAPTSATKLPATATVAPTASGGLPAIPDKMSYISQSIPDGQKFSPGENFTLIFTLKNIGTTTWDDKYMVRFFGGDRAGASDFNLETTVKPDATYNVTLKMTTPAKSGSYSTLWVITNPDGRNFGSFYLAYDVK